MTGPRGLLATPVGIVSSATAGVQVPTELLAATAADVRYRIWAVLLTSTVGGDAMVSPAGSLFVVVAGSSGTRVGDLFIDPNSPRALLELPGGLALLPGERLIGYNRSNLTSQAATCDVYYTTEPRT